MILHRDTLKFINVILSTRPMLQLYFTYVMLLLQYLKFLQFEKVINDIQAGINRKNVYIVLKPMFQKCKIYYCGTVKYTP